MDINKLMYQNYLLLAEQQNKLIKNILNINEVFSAFFMGANESEKNNIKMPCISINQQGEDSMKFQGKTIHKNIKCNTWYTRYRENGKQYYISGKTQKEVLTILKQKLNYVKKEKPKNYTLFEWYNQWLKLFKIDKVKESTIRDYNKCVKHINNNLLNKDIKKIESLEILNNLHKINLERTRQKVYELLNTIFTKAKQHNIINNNIMDIIDKPSHTKEKGIALTNKEQETFITECKNNKYGDLLLLTLYQGLRIGEVLAITGKDIDINKRKLIINKSINEKSEIDTTKNLQSNRTMPIFDNTLSILKKYQNQTNKRIFNFTYNVPQKHLKNIIQKCGIRDISLHDLRHTFITNCKNKQIPEHIIQTWVGHKIGSLVTSKVYTHSNEEDTLLYLEKYNKSL